jgi:hypothetical protein
MGQEAKRGGRGADRASRSGKVCRGDSSPHGSGGLVSVLHATYSESLKDPPAESQSMATAAKALARWENEGGRVLEAGQTRGAVS